MQDCFNSWTWMPVSTTYSVLLIVFQNVFWQFLLSLILVWKIFPNICWVIFNPRIGLISTKSNMVKYWHEVMSLYKWIHLTVISQEICGDSEITWHWHRTTNGLQACSQTLRKKQRRYCNRWTARGLLCLSCTAWEPAAY